MGAQVGGACAKGNLGSMLTAEMNRPEVVTRSGAFSVETVEHAPNACVIPVTKILCFEFSVASRVCAMRRSERDGGQEESARGRAPRQGGFFPENGLFISGQSVDKV